MRLSTTLTIFASIAALTGAEKQKVPKPAKAPKPKPEKAPKPKPEKAPKPEKGPKGGAGEDDSSPADFGFLGGCDKWSFKCSTTLFMCGVEQADTCENGKGVKDYQHASAEECKGLINAVLTNKYVGYKCPMDDGKQHAISHWSNYCKGKKCDAGSSSCEVKCKIPPSGGGGGDPHFRTYDGTSYSYHGECDMVMARSKEFGPDMVDLDLHIRTKSMGSWSLISNAALRIGNDILEFENDGGMYINGAEASLPYALDSRYSITKDIVQVESKQEDREIDTEERHLVVVDLRNGEQVRMALFKGMISVRVKAYLAETEGMLGVHRSAGMIARDGLVLEDANAMGEMWQVRDTEAMLFREARFPQYPAKCTPPSVDSRRRLRVSTAERERAEKACASINDYSRQFCVEDVLLTGDANVAAGYAFGEAF